MAHHHHDEDEATATDGLKMMLRAATLFFSCENLELVQLLCQDISQGKNTTLEEMEKEVVSWTMQHPAEASEICVLILHQTYHGPEQFRNQRPDTLAEKWLSCVTPDISLCHPVIVLFLQCLMQGIHQSLAPESQPESSDQQSPSEPLPTPAVKKIKPRRKIH